MIVVATHNDIVLIKDVCDNLSKIDLCGQNVLIVDTYSDNKEFVKTFCDLKNEYKEFSFFRTTEKCWDSGAYINAYKSFQDESKFIFLQDSLIIPGKSSYIIDTLNLLEKYDVVAWTNFPYKFENEEQQRWSEEDLILNKIPKDAIFGPIFSVNKKVLDRIPKKLLKYPTNKNEACGMERRWSSIFENIGATKFYLEYSPDGDVPSHSRNYICKNFKHRN